MKTKWILVILFAGLLQANAFGWTSVTTPNASRYGNTLKAIHARTSTDAWTVGKIDTLQGSSTLIEHWNGTSWSVVSSPNPQSCYGMDDELNGVVATSATNAWAVGYSFGCNARPFLTAILHWNGTSWSITPSPSPSVNGYNELRGVDSVTDNDAWAVGYADASNGASETLILRWNGTTWTRISSPNPSGSTSSILNSVSMLSATDAWAAGYYYDPQIEAFESLIEHWDGTKWSIVSSPNPSSTFNVLNSIKIVSAIDVWAVGYQSNGYSPSLTLIQHWDGSKWSTVASPNQSTAYGSQNELRGIGVISSNDIYVAGMYENESTDYHQHRPLIQHWDGSAWSFVDAPNKGQSSELYGITAVSTGQSWGAGLYSKYDIDIYDQHYTTPKTFVLKK